MISIISAGAILFLAFLLIHIFSWRIFRPHKDIEWLFVLYISVPLVFLAFFSWTALFLYLCLGAAYIASYPAVQAYSPSLDILLLFETKSTGLTREQILSVFDRSSIVTERVRDLRKSRLIVRENDLYRLSAFSRG